MFSVDGICLYCSFFYLQFSEIDTYSFMLSFDRSSMVFGIFDVELQSISLSLEIVVVYQWFVISIRFDRISSVVESNHVQLLCLLFTVNAN